MLMLNFLGNTTELANGLKVLAKSLDIQIDETGIPIEINKVTAKKLNYHFDEEKSDFCLRYLDLEWDSPKLREVF